MAEVDDSWTADSNEAFEVSLVCPSSKGSGFTTLARFNPKFTYPIFGEDERIFGYKDLKIVLRFHASDMRPSLEIRHSKKFKSIGDTEPTDVQGLLADFLPPVAFDSGRNFEAAIRDVAADWSPPGEILTTFDAKDGGTFEIRRGLLADPAIKQMLTRVQVLVPLFIEGGTFINTDPDSEALERWEIFFLHFKKPASSSPSDAPAYQFAGYTTVYKFFPSLRHALVSELPIQETLKLAGDFPLANLKSRNRISQFVILPPYQKAGNGGRLYGAVYKHYLGNPNITEVTVEDPNEAFDDMRDVTDLAFLRTTPEFSALRINTDTAIPRRGPMPHSIIDEEQAEATRIRYKIAPRQFARVLEMHLMSKLGESVRPSFEKQSAGRPTKAEQHEYDLWKLFVKARLYRHNKELLGQLDRSERIDKLNETLGNVEIEYARLLGIAQRRSLAGAGQSALNSAIKRKLGEDVDDGASSSSKKARAEETSEE